MKRIILVLTEAQAAWLRGAVNTYVEDMTHIGLHTKHSEKHADDILRQLSRRHLHDVPYLPKENS